MCVRVITPSLNKSFKFQSDWPDNNSQSYLLHSVANDLKNDSAYKFTQKDNDYVFTTKTNYPNNPKYVRQNITLDKKRNLKKVEVQDEEGTTYIEFTPKTIDTKAKFDNDQFNLDEVTKNFKNSTETDQNKEKEKTDDKQIKEEQENQVTEETTSQDSTEAEEDSSTDTSDNNNTTNTTDNNKESSTTSKIDENIFPLYLPTNTTLSDREVISTSNGERVIMTFSGDNPFILVEETIKPSTNLEIIPTYGEPFMLIDTVGSLTETSYTWTSNGVEYYIVSDQMKQNELLEVAKSINVVSAINQK